MAENTRAAVTLDVDYVFLMCEDIAEFDFVIPSPNWNVFAIHERELAIAFPHDSLIIVAFRLVGVSVVSKQSVVAGNLCELVVHPLDEVLNNGIPFSAA